MLRLSVLALRRTLPPWLFLGLLALLLLAARGPEHAPREVLDERALSGLRALGRQNVWSVLALCTPLFLWEAARLGLADSDAWLAPAPARRSAVALALLAGCALSALLSTGAAALVGELTTEPAPRAWERARHEPSPVHVLLDEDPVARWTIAAPAPGTRLRLWTGPAAGAGPAVDARLSARAGTEVRTVEARVAGLTALELEPPSARGASLDQGHEHALELVLERLGPGALLALPPRALEILRPVASERLIAWRLGSRALLALAAGGALAFGLARGLRPALAAGLVLALFLLACTRSAPPAWVPGSDLAEVWRALERGLVPASPPVAAWLGALGLALLGLGLHARARGAAEGRT